MKRRPHCSRLSLFARLSHNSTAGLSLSAGCNSDDQSSRPRPGGDEPRDQLYHLRRWRRQCDASPEWAGVWGERSSTAEQHVREGV